MEKQNNIKKEIIGTVLDTVIAIAIGCLLFGVISQPVLVKGASMENTLHDGEFLIGLRLDKSLERGDIVVISTNKFGEDGYYIIKRIIGVSGDTVVIDYEKGLVSVNGKALDEPYIKEEMRNPAWGEPIYTYTVSDGCIFVMGDNRNNSSDSRVIGEINTNDVKSRIFWSVSEFHAP